MNRLLEDQSAPEHLLREWLPDDREEVLRDVDGLLTRGLEIVYADTHAGADGTVFVAFPRPSPHPAAALVALAVHHGSHHIRTIALRHVVEVRLDDEGGITRLTIQTAGAGAALVLAAEHDPQRGWLRGLAEQLHVRLLTRAVG